MKMGKINLNHPLILAPMAGITNQPFRLICKEFGAALVYTEMISAWGLARGDQRTHSFLNIHPEERPINVQIFGANPEIMAKAAKIVEDAGADVIDINMGCSVKKVVKNGAGAALLKDLSLAKKIVNSVSKAVRIPLTIKVRKGWDDNSLTIKEIVRIAEDAGVAAIAIHGRTAVQGFKDEADWEIVAEIKQMTKIPIIGNGDIVNPLEVKEKIEKFGCDAVMIGRGARGNPWIFQQALNFLKKGEIKPPPSLSEKITVILRHLKMNIALYGELVAVRLMRKHIAWYLKGLPNSAKIKCPINQAETLAEVTEILNNYTRNLIKNYGNKVTPLL